MSALGADDRVTRVEPVGREDEHLFAVTVWSSAMRARRFGSY
jgi:hypothetical protein